MTAWLFTIRVSPGMLVLGGGFEPTCLSLIRRLPIPYWRPQHSLRADYCQPYYGVPAESRTPDAWIKSPLLYLLSYRHILWRSVRDLNTELQVLQTAALPFDQPTSLSGCNPTTGFSLLPANNGIRRRSRTLVKGLEIPCTIHYTIRTWCIWWDLNPHEIALTSPSS